MKKVGMALLFLCVICAFAYATGQKINTPSVVIPGEVVSDAPQPRATMEIGGERLQYENTMETDLTTIMNFQNAEIKDQE